MTRKDIAKAIGTKLLAVRQIYKLSMVRMAGILNCDRVSYVRNENGRAIPNFFTIYNLGSQFDISLNWFILDEGPMNLKEIMTVEKVEPVSPPLAEDLKELLDHMEKIPLLRHEILVQFYRFREDHPAMVEKAMRGKEK